MSKPQNCSAGGYCDCLQKLESLGYFDEDTVFLGLALSPLHAAIIAELRSLTPDEPPFDVVVSAACEVVLESLRGEEIR